MIDKILAAGLQGIQRGLSGAAEKVEKISRAFLPESDIDPVDPIVGLKADEHQIKASAKVIKVADDLNKSILDILA